jgi:hypothetical protein
MKVPKNNNNMKKISLIMSSIPSHFFEVIQVE